MRTDYVVPVRQIEMLDALANGRPVPARNAATRKSLEERGLINVIDREKWQLEITERGRSTLAFYQAQAAAQSTKDETNNEEKIPMTYLLDTQFIEPWKLTKAEFEAWRESVADRIEAAFPLSEKPADLTEIKREQLDRAQAEQKRLELLLNDYKLLFADDEAKIVPIQQQLDAATARISELLQKKAEVDQALQAYEKLHRARNKELQRWFYEAYPHLIGTPYIIREASHLKDRVSLRFDFDTDNFHLQKVAAAARHIPRLPIPEAVLEDYQHVQEVEDHLVYERISQSDKPKPVPTFPTAILTSILKLDDSAHFLFEDVGSSTDHKNRRYRRVRMNILNRSDDGNLGTFLSTDLHLSQVEMMIEKLTALRSQMLPGDEPATNDGKNNMPGAA